MRFRSFLYIVVLGSMAMPARSGADDIHLDEVIRGVAIPPMRIDEYRIARDTKAPSIPVIEGCKPFSALDFDGDGIANEAEHLHTTHGPHIADRPEITLSLASDITPRINWSYTGTETRNSTATTVLSSEWERLQNTSSNLSITNHYREESISKGGYGFSAQLGALLQGDFGKALGDSSFTFSGSDEQKETYEVIQTRAANLQVKTHLLNTFKNTLTDSRMEIIEWGEKDGQVTATLRLTNSSPFRNILVEEAKFLLSAYHPKTGYKQPLADFTRSWRSRPEGGITLGPNQSALARLEVTEINTDQLLGILLDGQTFAVELLETPIIYEWTSNGQRGDLLSTHYNNVAGATAEMTVVFGGSLGATRFRPAVYAPEAKLTNCMTVAHALVERFGEQNVEFGKSPSGERVVTRIENIRNMYADEDFDKLSPSKQAAYGKWVIGFQPGLVSYPQVIDIDYELKATDRIYLYYLRGEDFLTADEPYVDTFDDSVGVIPLNGSCPGAHPDLLPLGSQRVTFWMDNEDSNNNTRHWGWTGSIHADADGNGNTRLIFCRVDGDKFRQVLSSTSYRYSYAVLKLDDNCPLGSVEFARYHDTEDSSNQNSASGPFAPNKVTRQGIELRYCLFKGTPSSADRHMETFPDLGVQYGVFAPDDAVGGLRNGVIHIDDEDDDNMNWFWAPGAIESDARRMVEPYENDRNTRFHLMQVK